jgi:hypothetical protein
LVPGSFYEAAAATTRQMHVCRHLDVEHVDEVLQDIRSREPRRQILVITEALFATEADTADLGALQAVCRRHDALRCVSVSNDLGALGPGGTGCLGEQHQLGQVDLVMGSFFPTLAGSGGFVAAVRAGLTLHGGIVMGATAPMIPESLGRKAVGRMAARLCAERGVQVPIRGMPLDPDLDAARIDGIGVNDGFAMPSPYAKVR